MNYAIISANTITAHGRPDQLWPDTSFPASGPNASFLIDAGAVLIRSDATYDPETEILQATEPYVLNGEVFNTIAAPKPAPPAPPAPEPQWVAFGAVVMEQAEIKALLNQAIVLGESPLAMGLAVGLGKAADGDSRVFLDAWGKAVAGGLVPAGLIAQVQTLAGAYDLPAEFIAGLAGAPSMEPPSP
jgi:hypothetical protein